jgi:hypothetical protein
MLIAIANGSIAPELPHSLLGGVGGFTEGKQQSRMEGGTIIAKFIRDIICPSQCGSL